MLKSLDGSLANVSIRDSTTLGKYNSSLTRPRSILVKFNEADDISNILSKRSKVAQLSSPVSIKPDLSKEEREIEAVLLKERRSLINKGVSKKDIKIREKCLYIGRKLHGKSDSSTFIIHHAPCGTLNSSVHSELSMIITQFLQRTQLSTVLMILMCDYHIYYLLVYGTLVVKK